MDTMFATDNAKELLNGYSAYTTPVELDADAVDAAPATTPATSAILSFIGESSLACGVGISAIGGSIYGTVSKGC